ncbi:ATP-binding protein [Lyngbya confervoides]|uniref:ATP-binding protein n=1 Tax=Lyngbya confervoides BDU141951 TaxID=1574623 RepID=A0ABD4T2Q3_9CYAN|nr:ATP-binding protein [Lyngbya confervoides]MCM1982630.1 ATP-binding protein [Lyngbya confervoides BDU141951]
MANAPPIKPKERDAILQSLRAGVVPRMGLQHIQVGRSREIEALLTDLERIEAGGSSMRFIIGEYGSGKTFFLTLIRAIALQKKMVTAHGDLTPERRLQASGGQARSLYCELMRNLSTRAKPEGGAIASVVERFVTSAMTEAKAQETTPAAIIQDRLAYLSEWVGGYDFAQVVEAYWRGHDTGDDGLKSHAIRWLRGEFSTKTEARQALGVRTIVEDANIYDQIKLMAQLIKLAGYRGCLICLDELVNLYKLSNPQARSGNYEQILRILNDTLQGNGSGLGFLLGGTPDFLRDKRRGLYSYPALQTRLGLNPFASQGLVDYSGPVLELHNLQPEDLFILLTKIQQVFVHGQARADLLQAKDIQDFMAHCSQRIGDAYFRTPRNTIMAFINLLAILQQNPQIQIHQLIAQQDIGILAEATHSAAPSPRSATTADEFSTFEL